jgi:hypothetical protein
MIELAKHFLAAGIEFHNLQIQEIERGVNGAISDGRRVRQDGNSRLGLVAVTELLHFDDDVRKRRIESRLAIAADRNGIDRSMFA